MKKQNLLKKGLLILVLLGLVLASSFSQDNGDVNKDGAVTIVDALMIAQEFVGLNPVGFDAAYADANCDGAVTIVDALIVAQYFVGLVDSIDSCGTEETPTPTPTTGPETPTPTYGDKVDNPFAGASWYVDPVWSQKAIDGGAGAIAGNNTAVWMDRIGAITDGIGLVGHLDAAVAQGANMIQVVIYDLPNRDCNASASNGELLIAEDGFNRYVNEYIDPIVEIMSNAAYAGLRIVCIIEPDSLPNLVTNLSVPGCSEANGTGGYVDGIQYALDALGTVPNTYCYLDLGHSGWLGWDSNFGPGVSLISNCIAGTNNGYNSVAGFVTCTANYTPVEEPYLANPYFQINYMDIRSADFYEWNPYFDEMDYAQDMRSAFISAGFPSTIGMLIDSSRSGWGGDDRPTGVSSSTNLNTYVDESRIDRRYHRGNWCNQPGGIGFRPTANPATGIDAYVWVKPPGESDGVSEDGIIDPTDPNKQFDIMCDPDGYSTSNSAYPTGAIEAPHAGRWNQLHIEMLMDNAYPAL